MAIYHLSVKVISRSRGRSAVAAAAYRAAEKLRDDALGKTHNYQNKRGVLYRDIMAPDGAPAWVFNRAALWNAATAAEKRKDSQLARDVEIALPVELSGAEHIELMRTYVYEQFVTRGMVADFAIHNDNPANPHAHIMLTTRSIGPDGFGRKETAWNQKPMLMLWRSEWAALCNERLAFAGSRARVDHRSFEDQGINLQPTQKIGIATKGSQWKRTGSNRALPEGDLSSRPPDEGLQDQGRAGSSNAPLGADAKWPTAASSAPAPVHPDLPQHNSGNPKDGREIIAERLKEHDRIVWENGENIARFPGIALFVMTRHEATFTDEDMRRWVHARTLTRKQYDTCLDAILQSPELVALSSADGEAPRWTTQEMLATEKRLLRVADIMHRRPTHKLNADTVAAVEDFEQLSDEQQRAVLHITHDAGDIAIVEGYAGTGKSTMLAAARKAWEAQGYRVWGGTVSGRAAESLEIASDIPSRTLASWERAWSKGADALTPNDVFVVDEASMLGTNQLEHVAWKVGDAGAKLVLVGDSAQLHAIDAGAPMRALAARVGQASLTTIRRQQDSWQQQASVALAEGRTTPALLRYARAGHVHAYGDVAKAQAAMVAAHQKAVREDPGATTLMLAYRREEVRTVNMLARAQAQQAGRLGVDQAIRTAHGQRLFAVGERICCTRNDRTLGVRNGSLATIERIVDGHLMMLRLDGDEGRHLIVDLKAYDHFDYGYASTVHRAQGQTVDRAFVLASWSFDRHAAYVALTRHRQQVELYYPEQEFKSIGRLAYALSRPRYKDLALDYEQVDIANRALHRTFSAHSEKPEPQPKAAAQSLVRAPTPALSEQEREALAREQVELLRRRLVLQKDADNPLIKLREAFLHHPLVNEAQQQVDEKQDSLKFWRAEVLRQSRRHPEQLASKTLQALSVVDPSTKESMTLGEAVRRAKEALASAVNARRRLERNRSIHTEAVRLVKQLNEKHAEARAQLVMIDERLGNIRTQLDGALRADQRDHSRQALPLDQQRRDWER